MKKISILSGILLIACLCHGQRFFYIQDSQPTQKILTDELQHAFQYVTTTPLASDYIIKSEVGFQAETHSLTMQITLQDSITFQTIFQANESCDIRKTNPDVRLFLSLAVRTFLEKNIRQILICSKDDHFNTEMKILRPRKDKS